MAVTDTQDESADDADERRYKAILRSHVAQLAEFFDTVQVVVTTHDSQHGTTMRSWGEGNYYARTAAAESWVKSAKRS